MTANAKFRQTVVNLLAMPPIKQKEVARKARLRKAKRKFSDYDLDALIAIAEAHMNLDNEDLDDEEVLMNYLLSDEKFRDALIELRELRKQRG